MPEALNLTPAFSEREASQLAQTLYGLDARAQDLPGERDQNFRLEDEAGAAYVLKLANAGAAEAALECQNQILKRLVAIEAFAFPRLVPTRAGEPMVLAKGPNGTDHWVRLLTHLPGTFLAHVNPHPPALLRELGTLLGTVDRALEGFDHPGAHRYLDWDLTHAATVVRRYLPLIPAGARRDWIERILLQFETDVLPMLSTLRPGVIHNDANDHNVLVDAAVPRISGLIDFGDVVHAPLVCEPAIGAAYALLDKSDPLAAAAEVVGGYHEAYPLDEAELDVLFCLIRMRLCVSACLSAKGLMERPGDDYLQISTRPVWAALEPLHRIDPVQAAFAFKRVCAQVSAKWRS